MHALRTKTARLTTTAVLTLGAAGGFLAVGAASASATVRPELTSCNHNGLGICAKVDQSTQLWSPSNTRDGSPIPSGTVIEVTCWYPGPTADGDYDHVAWITGRGNVTGHVDDDNVDLGGEYGSAALPRC